MSGNKMNLPDKIKKMKNGLKLHTYQELGEEKGKMPETKVIEKDGQALATYESKDGKTLETSATVDAQKNGTFEDNAPKGIKKDELVYTAPTLRGAQAAVSEDKDNKPKIEKAKLLNKASTPAPKAPISSGPNKTPEAPKENTLDYSTMQQPKDQTWHWKNKWNAKPEKEKMAFKQHLSTQRMLHGKVAKSDEDLEKTEWKVPGLVPIVADKDKMHKAKVEEFNSPKQKRLIRDDRHTSGGEKGVHQPAGYTSGNSKAGQATRSHASAGPETGRKESDKKTALNEHAKVLGDLKTMSKPNLGKSEEMPKDNDSKYATSELASVMHHLEEIKAKLNPGKDMPDEIGAKIAEIADRVACVAHYLDSHEQPEAMTKGDVVGIKDKKTISTDSKPASDKLINDQHQGHKNVELDLETGKVSNPKPRALKKSTGCATTMGKMRKALNSKLVNQEPTHEHKGMKVKHLKDLGNGLHAIEIMDGVHKGKWIQAHETEMQPLTKTNYPQKLASENIEANMQREKANPSKYPGGKKQAVAIGISQAKEHKHEPKLTKAVHDIKTGQKIGETAQEGNSSSGYHVNQMNHHVESARKMLDSTSRPSINGIEERGPRSPFHEGYRPRKGLEQAFANHKNQYEHHANEFDRTKTAEAGDPSHTSSLNSKVQKMRSALKLVPKV